MINRRVLLTDLQRQVKRLETDLREQLDERDDARSRLREEHRQALRLARTAATWTSWRDERVTQTAVAWVLGTVFVRFCEDNGLLPTPYLAGPTTQRMALAEDAQSAHFRSNPQDTDRDWILTSFAAIGSTQAGALLFDPKHNAAYQLPISHDAAKELIGFWRRRNEGGTLVHDFRDDKWDTRFLGDLYQDLSEHAKKTYALLQTPEFVEEFILDRTMTPALDEFGLNGFRMIDPTCGSGHFLLGAFRRLVNAWERESPTKDVYERTRLALTSIHGVDINPFAVAIARFRLLLAAVRECGFETLAKTERLTFPINIAIGDSLIMGGRQLALIDHVDDVTTFAYSTEDVHEFPEILKAGRYHLVVGNPPYPTVKDKSLNALYRKHYRTCSGKYALSVPFAQRFFELAMRGEVDTQLAGYVGQITANSFMKREFGKKLIEDYFAHSVELTEVIDTSGAYIPGHGTPTVILIGRRRDRGRRPIIRTVMGVRGEPSQPANPANGRVWRAIIDQIDKPNSESEWATVADVDRGRLETFPWSLAGGGAAELMAAVEGSAAQLLGTLTEHCGFTAITAEDDAYFFEGPGFIWRSGIEAYRPMVEGDQIRDHRISVGTHTVWPYNDDLNARPLTAMQRMARHFWPNRRVMQRRKRFGRYIESLPKQRWWEYGELYREKLRTALSIAFAFVATHNHFVLDRGGKVFNRSAPVIKLPEGATEEDHLRLLGLLNSSTACFWLKQVSHNKGSTVDAHGARQTTVPWEDFYEFTGTKLEAFPVPEHVPLQLATKLDRLARELSDTSPDAVCARETPARDRLTAARKDWDSTRAQMFALQEELDWECYLYYGVLGEDLRAPAGFVPELKLGERAFEIVLARRMARGETETQWFARHRSVPITEIPQHWPEAYKKVVGRRIELIETNRYLALIERPECKRRWATDGWDTMEKAALRTWLLDRLESRELWHAVTEHGDEQPRPMSTYHLADRMRRDREFVDVVALYKDRRDADLANVVSELVADEHIPYLAALRYKDSGLAKRADWEGVWELQRREDRGETLDSPIPVPPKYKSTDFAKPSYWRHRGKLDVPKERFISYPYASRDGDPSLLLGWAGWDHAEQAQVLATLVVELRDNHGWKAERLTPLLAGLREVMPWVKQWHAEIDPRFGQSPAEIYPGFLDEETNRHHLTESDLSGWRARR